MAHELVEIVGGLVRIYAPDESERPTDYRLRWRNKFDTPDDTSATSLEAARRRAADLVLELTTDVGARLSVQFSAVVAAYVADADWNPNHGNQQLSLLRTWIIPWLGGLATNQIRVTHTEDMLRAAAGAGRARSTVLHIRRAGVNVMRWAHAHNWMLPTHDPFSAARIPKMAAPVAVVVDGAARDVVRPDQIPTHHGMHDLAHSAALLPARGVRQEDLWWRELEYNTAGYCGLRWGERVGLIGGKIDLESNTILVDIQVIELDRANEKGERLYTTLPKWCRVRNAWFPDYTPLGYPLKEMLALRKAEVGDDGLMFPAPTQPDTWQRRSNHNRRVFKEAVLGTPTWNPDHDLHGARHLYCSWLLNELGLELDDVSVLAGHSSVASTKRYLGVRPHAATRAAAAATAAGLTSGKVPQSRPPNLVVVK